MTSSIGMDASGLRSFSDSTHLLFSQSATRILFVCLTVSLNSDWFSILSTSVNQPRYHILHKYHVLSSPKIHASYHRHFTESAAQEIKTPPPIGLKRRGKRLIFFYHPRGRPGSLAVSLSPLLLELPEQSQLHLLHHLHHPPRLRRVAVEPKLLLHLPLQLALHPRRQAAAQVRLVVAGAAEPPRRRRRRVLSAIARCVGSGMLLLLGGEETRGLGWLVFVDCIQKRTSASPLGRVVHDMRSKEK